MKSKSKFVSYSTARDHVYTLGWYYDLFDTLLRNPQIAGDFGNIACDFVEDHNELFKSQVISIFKSQVISILARVRM